MSEKITAKIYNQKGGDAGSVELPAEVFGLKWNADLVKQVVDSTLSSRRKPVAHVKTRGEVAGGGKKPWKQKGTGRARHGSIRSPIWVGGGVTHGPRKDKNYTRIVPKKMKAKALFTILSRKYKEGEILFVDNFGLKDNKTKEAVRALSGLSSVSGFENLLSKRKNSAVIALSSKQREVEKSFRNLGNVEVVEARNMDLISLLGHKYLVIENPEEALKVLPGSALTKKSAPKASPKKLAAKS